MLVDRHRRRRMRHVHITNPRRHSRRRNHPLHFRRYVHQLRPPICLHPHRFHFHAPFAVALAYAVSEPRRRVSPRHPVAPGDLPISFLFFVVACFICPTCPP